MNVCGRGRLAIGPAARKQFRSGFQLPMLGRCFTQVQVIEGMQGDAPLLEGRAFGEGLLDGGGIAPFDQDAVPGTGVVVAQGLAVGGVNQRGRQEEFPVPDQMAGDAQHAAAHGQADVLAGVDPALEVAPEFFVAVLLGFEGDVHDGAFERDADAAGAPARDGLVFRAAGLFESAGQPGIGGHLLHAPVAGGIADFRVQGGGEGYADAGHGGEQGPGRRGQMPGNVALQLVDAGVLVLVDADFVGQVGLYDIAEPGGRRGDGRGEGAEPFRLGDRVADHEEAKFFGQRLRLAGQDLAGSQAVLHDPQRGPAEGGQAALCLVEEAGQQLFDQPVDAHLGDGLGLDQGGPVMGLVAEDPGLADLGRKGAAPLLVDHERGDAQQVELVGAGGVVFALPGGVVGVQADAQVSFHQQGVDEVVGKYATVLAAEQDAGFLDGMLAPQAVDDVLEEFNPGEVVVDMEGCPQQQALAVADQRGVLLLGVVDGNAHHLPRGSRFFEQLLNCRIRALEYTAHG